LPELSRCPPQPYIISFNPENCRSASKRCQL
jgi:hypothetical protein